MWLPILKAVGLDRQPFHLVGSSMGGNVAGVYAAQHPTHLATLTLICPAGLVVPRDSGFVRLLKTMKDRGEVSLKDVPLIPSSTQQMAQMMTLCCHRNVNLPRQILKGLLASRLPNNDFYSQGLVVPRDSGFVRLLKTMKDRGEVSLKDVPLIPSSTQQMAQMMTLCCHRNVNLPRQRGSPSPSPSLLLLHGFSANKDMWLPILKAVGLDRQPFHLVGSSMGGNVAGVYAAQHPTHLATLTLICPAGLVVPRDSGFVRLLKTMKDRGEVSLKDVPLIPSSTQQMAQMMTLCCHRNVNLPRQDCLHLVSTPLLVIWGRDDQVIDVSGASVLQEAHPTCQVALLERCGHARVVVKDSVYQYLKVSLVVEGLQPQATATQLKHLVCTALRSLYGEVGAAFPFDLLTFEEDTLTAVLRVHSRGLLRVWSSLTLLGTFQQQRCAFRVLQVSPYLLALTGNSRDLTLD
ncbi:hypothetical protein CRUP_012725 [Coryphaenoides rupestris]|nr:hypothetical protein CRUP_012725 [Coryphaenoides rupestris]